MALASVQRDTGPSLAGRAERSSHAAMAQGARHREDALWTTALASVVMGGGGESEVPKDAHQGQRPILTPHTAHWDSERDSISARHLRASMAG